MLLLCLQVRVNAQEFKGLTIGEMLPDLGITKMMNNTAASSNISSYKGKLLILDFMATSCGGCIKALPRLDSLQHKFSDRVAVLLVTVERQERVTAFLKRHPGFRLPFVAEDTTLASLFPHQFLSHIAWIDQTGKVRAISASEYITEQNIQTILRGETVHWPVKRDFTSFDFDEPILTVNENNIPQVDMPVHSVYTAVTNYLPGVQKHIGIKKDSSNSTSRLSYINYSIYQLYLLLYQSYNLPKSRILLGVKNRERFVYDPATGTMEDWKLKNLYCLEAVLPANLDSAAQQQKLLTDLDFYFSCKGRMEKRLTDCLILQNKQTNIKVNTNAGKGIRVGMLEYLLNDSIGAVPVINETTCTTYTTLPLTVELIRDDAYLRKMLDQYGLELVKGQRMINCLVITQPSSAK
jgi:thiol-disulfide isomerase/thioredoxin